MKEQPISIAEPLLNPHAEGHPATSSDDMAAGNVPPSSSFDTEKMPSRDHTFSIEDNSEAKEEQEEKSCISRFKKMKRNEKIELGFESAFTLYLQVLTALYSLEEIAFLKNNFALLFSSIFAYALASTAFSMRSIYNLGPYPFNVLHLTGKIEKLSLAFDKLNRAQELLDNDIRKSNKIIFDRLEKENKFLNDFPDSINVSAEKTQKSRGLLLSKPKLSYLDYIEMLVNGGIGIIIGKNVNLICNINQATPQGFVFPALFSALNAGANISIFNRIKNDKLPLPSNMLVQHAREQINSIKAVIRNMNDYREKVLNTKWRELSAVIKHLENEERVVSAQEEDKKSEPREERVRGDSHIQIEGTPTGNEDNDLVTGMPRDYSGVKSVKKTRAVIAFHIFMSALPLFISLLTTVIAVQSEAENKKNRTTVEAQLIAAGIVYLAIIVIRSLRYHSEDARELVAYSHFYEANAVTIQKRAENLVSAEDSMNGLIYMGSLFKKDSKINEFNLRPCIANNLLFAFIKNTYLELNYAKFNYYHFKVKNKPQAVIHYEKYLKENDLIASEENLKNFCYDHPGSKAELNRLYEDHLSKNKKISEKTGLLSFRRK